ncbi:hypothetical protein DFP72DRAFT_813073 [Ephemerocybe angulata]|uniref:F-box domain-containing protein n=1 Tax=Ephemerocybe angulata TaxID=980116 RepID=A0A8H6M4H8_9AGAR|nr:hypothetical protein DFP72DRAFT_813073 [Tulosesus angulatus]
MSTFSSLPGELYDAIVQQIPDEDHQQSILALTRALPRAPIPQKRLFECIYIRYPRQAVSLNRRLRQKAGDERNPAGSWVQRLYIQDWSVDADVVLNTIHLLPNLQSLCLWIGPNNFAPEHLEELFANPFGDLRYLSLRFRPYVQKANYYQFLKGAYFDSTLLALARWPPGRMPCLSIVQDPIDSTMTFASRQSFAQPLVFFKMDPNMAIMLQSPAMVDSLKSLRLRIPGRPMVRSLCLPSAAQVNSDGEVPQVPALELLDLSTCGVLEGEVDMILAQFSTLKHLLLDECPILRGELREGEWSAMGKRCALVGVRRAREREKIIKAAMETIALAVQLEQLALDGEAAQLPPPRRARRGRRGVAISTISLRAPSPPRGLDALRARIAKSSAGNQRGRNNAIQRTRLLPPLPSLRTLCTTVSASVKPESYPAIRSEFEAGWAEGIAVLAVTRARLRDSAKNGVSTIVRFTEDAPFHGTSSSGSGSESGTLDAPYSNVMHGLEKVDKNDAEAFSMPAETAVSVPILCFAGPKGVVDHAPGCGHSVAQSIWRD